MYIPPKQINARKTTLLTSKCAVARLNVATGAAPYATRCRKYIRFDQIFSYSTAAAPVCADVVTIEKGAYQNLRPSLQVESDLTVLRYGVIKISKGIRRIRVQRIADIYQETDRDREFSPAPFTHEDPKIRPEMRSLSKDTR